MADYVFVLCLKLKSFLLNNKPHSGKINHKYLLSNNYTRDSWREKFEKKFNFLGRKVSEKKSKLEAAEDRAIKAEADMKQAAQFGKELLDKLNQSETIKSELVQKINSLKLDLTSVRANEKALNEQINDLNQRLVVAENSSKFIESLHKELEDAKLGFEKKEDYISTIKESKTNLEEDTKKLAKKEPAPLLPSNSTNNSILDQNDLMDQLQKYMRQSLKDSDKLSELTKSFENLERQLRQLKAENDTLQNELNSYRTASLLRHLGISL